MRIKLALLEALEQVEGELAIADPNITPRARRSRGQALKARGAIL